MKYLFVILSGAADEPLPELGERTPLIAGSGEHLIDLRRRGRAGMVRLFGEGEDADPEAALIALLGFDPRQSYTGAGALEAAAAEIDLDRGDLAFRLDLAAIRGNDFECEPDQSLTPAQRRELVMFAQERLGARTFQLFPTAGRHQVAVWRQAPHQIRCTPPARAAGRPLAEVMPQGDRAGVLTGILWDSAEILEDHPINRRLRDQGLPAAGMLWPWAPGAPMRLPQFGPRHGMSGIFIAGATAALGAARLTGLTPWQPPGATGNLDTDYRVKARAAIEALTTQTLCVVHIAAPAVASAAGDWEAKTDSIRRIDERFFGVLLDRIALLGEFRLLVAIDSIFSSLQRAPLPGAVPFLLSGAGFKQSGGGIVPFDERAIDEQSQQVSEGWRLSDLLTGAAD